MGRLLSNVKPRTLVEIKRKVSSKIYTTIKVVIRHMRDASWVKMQIMPSGYSIYSEE